MEESTQLVEEKNLKIDELESDLKEAQDSAISTYGSSKKFLESENLRLLVKNDELQKQILELRQAARNQRPVSPDRDRVPKEIKRRTAESTVKMQSPTKRSKIADLGLDDDSQCNPQ